MRTFFLKLINLVPFQSVATSLATSQQKEHLLVAIYHTCEYKLHGQTYSHCLLHLNIWLPQKGVLYFELIG